MCAFEEDDHLFGHFPYSVYGELVYSLFSKTALRSFLLFVDLNSTQAPQTIEQMWIGLPSLFEFFKTHCGWGVGYNVFYFSRTLRISLNFFVFSQRSLRLE